MPKPPSILIAVPVFQGAHVVSETLASISSQDFKSFRVLISVDGNDERSYAVCRQYHDPRFKVILQPNRLGWADNLNWLASQLREDFFCYWQQDDLCDPTYLRALYKHATRHPEASAVYCDMEYFGGKEGAVEYPSVTGFALERVLHQIAQNNPLPHRGLIRSAAMRAALPVTQPGPLVVTLAREGELHRVPKLLYRKRVLPTSLSAKLREAPPEELRARTLEWGLGNLKAALPVVQRAETTRLLTYLIDQLVNHRPCRAFHYVARTAGPDEPLRLVVDFLREARTRCGVFAFAELMSGSDTPWALIERKDAYRTGSVQALMVEAVLKDFPASCPPERIGEAR